MKILLRAEGMHGGIFPQTASSGPYKLSTLKLPQHYTIDFLLEIRD